MVGLSEGNKFLSSASPTLGEQFWLTAFFKKPFSLREGADVQKVSNSEEYPLAARSGSWHSLLRLWRNGGLNRAVLRDWSDTSQVDRYFDTCTPSSLATSTRSLLGQRCSRLRSSRDCSGAFSSQLDLSVPETQNDTAGLRTVAPLDTLSSTSSLPTSRVMGFRTRSRTPRPIKGPLVPVEPRRDGNVARLLCAPVPPSIAAVPDVVKSQIGTTRDETPENVPIRGCLDNIKQLMAGDVYIGRGSRQRGLQSSVWTNDNKVSVYGRAAAVQQFGEKLRRENSWKDLLWTLSGVRLVCHCLPSQSCHGDEIVREYKNQQPAAFDREEEGGDPPEAAVLDYLSRLREVPMSDTESSADEDIPMARAGWIGTGEPMVIGSGYTRREVCDGMSLASPGRWPPDQRNYPQSVEWLEVAEKVREFARREGPPELLMKLSLGQVNACPFPEQAIRSLKDELIASLAARGKVLKQLASDRTDLPIDFRFLELLLDASGDEVGLGSFSQGVRIGVGARLPRLPALYKRKKKWRLACRSDPHDYLKTRLAQRVHGGATTPRSMNLQTRLKKLGNIRPGEGRSSDFRNQKPGVSFRTAAKGEGRKCCYGASLVRWDARNQCGLPDPSEGSRTFSHCS